MQNTGNPGMQSGMPGQGISKETITRAKTAECDCGGVLFDQSMLFKRISAIVSPSGKEELYPIQVIICKSCGKVPSWFIKDDILPEDVIAKPIN